MTLASRARSDAGGGAMRRAATSLLNLVPLRRVSVRLGGGVPPRPRDTSMTKRRRRPGHGYMRDFESFKLMAEDPVLRGRGRFD